MTIETDKIRTLNDCFRTRFSGGTLHMTDGVATLPTHQSAAVLSAVREFTAFDNDNDPHQEHDFGAIDLFGSKFFWKIDYYAKGDFSAGSENPADPDKTTRVLTIMLASEY